MSVFLINLLLTNILIAQVSSQGPASGAVSSGYQHSTDDMAGKLARQSGRLKIFTHYSPAPIEENDPVKPTMNLGENYLLDPSYKKLDKTTSDDIVVFKSLRGMDFNGFTPPDPTLAVGPDHIVQMVNTDVRIIEKSGREIITFNANDWYSDLINIEVLADPKVIYDHFESRWVMIWMSPNFNLSESYLVISVSDDENPVGTWFTWFLPAHVNGSTPSGNWIDYPGLGFDDKAIYVTGNMFTFASNYSYVSLRIINKNDLYKNSTPGRVNWTDFWDIKYPGTSNSAVGIRPVRSHSPSANAYLIATRWGGSFNSSIGYFKISNPATNPVLTGRTIATSIYEAPPAPQQPGGGEYPIENRGILLSHEPEFRNGIIHLAHEARYQTKAGVRYLSIDVNSESVVTDVTFGTPEHYHLFPSVSVNSDNDALLTYSRTSVNEYAGAYFSIFYGNTTSNSGSIKLKAGLGPYNVVAEDRNRWGDYMGAYVDPVDDISFWVNTEYADEGNRWSTWVAGISPKSFTNAYLNVDKLNLDFNETEVGFISDPQLLTIKNLGQQNLVIDRLEFSSSSFEYFNDPGFPITLINNDSVQIAVIFSPKEYSSAVETIEVISNSQLSYDNIIYVQGIGYEITKVNLGEFYASTGRGAGSLGKVLSINTESGAGEPLGEESGFSTLRSLTINPKSSELWALNSIAGQLPKFVRIRATDGAGYLYEESTLDLNAITFDKSGIIHGVTKDGKYYRIDIEKNDTSHVKNLGIEIAALASHPNSNDLYASVAASTDKDRVYKISLKGDTTLLGRTGHGSTVEALSFDGEGNLYGAVGRETQFSNLINIDTETGIGSEIGPIGFRGVLGLAFMHEGLVSVKSELTKIPETFELHQNYPNPFNPSTNISFSLPVDSNVELKVFNSLGELVEILFKGTLNSGKHTLNWNVYNRNFASGLYVYSLDAEGINAEIFSLSKKMILMK